MIESDPVQPRPARIAGDPPRRDLAGARCVVTGGLGFIGSNLSLALASAGARVHVVDALVPGHGGHRRNLEGAAAPIAVTIADLADSATLAPIVRDADVVFNLAGQISHLDSMDDPMADLDHNARSHLAFLEVLRRQGSGAVVVHTSTRQVYGRARRLPVDEDHRVEPVDVNGITQWAGEQFHLLYARVHGLRACSLRLTNVYGPRQRLTEARQGVLGTFLRRALLGEPLRVFGDGAQRRDLLHVDDVVDALLAAATTPAIVGAVLNVSHPEPLSLRAIAEAIAEAVGGVPVVSVPWPAEHAAIDIGDFVSDSSRARRLLGWQPRTGLREGVASTVQFFRERRSWYL